jgi:DNA polymerase III alpha subunit
VKTVLKDRELWFDGAITFSVEQLKKHILNFGSLNNVFVDSENNFDIIQYNKLSNKKFVKKISIGEISNSWNIPARIKHMDVYNFIMKKFMEKMAEENFNKNDIINRIQRIKKEYSLYQKLDLIELLLCSIYIVEEFEKNNIIWGTGRGSSCASYILYILGLHEIDCVLYDIDYKEFFKTDG